MVAVSIVARIVEWLQPAYEKFGYVIVGVGVLLERSIFIGLVVPGDVILALGGVYSSPQHRHLDLVWVIVLGTLAAIAGESIGFWLGRRYGKGLLSRLPLLNRLADRLDAAEEYFRRHGGKTVFIGRYATAAGAFIPFVAGMARMPYLRFLLFDVPAIIIWAAGITIFGYVFGENIELVDRYISRFGWFVLGAAVLFFGVRYLLKRRRRRTS